MSIDISRPWARTSPGIEGQAGGFFTVTNKGGEADLLVAAASPAAARIDIHGIRVVGSVITMRSMEKGLRVPPDTAITLKPRGYHLLLLGVRAPLAKGSTLPGSMPSIITRCGIPVPSHMPKVRGSVPNGFLIGLCGCVLAAPLPSEY